MKSTITCQCGTVGNQNETQVCVSCGEVFPFWKNTIKLSQPVKTGLSVSASNMIKDANARIGEGASYDSVKGIIDAAYTRQ